MALVLVLSVLVLMMVLVLGLLSMGSSETRSAGAFSRSVQARTLTELPVNVTMAQIRKATSGLDTSRTWTSQPGMIRVFGTVPNSSLGRSNLEKAYKLYSSDVMEADSSFSVAAETAAMKDWNTQEALFTDLNAPVSVLQSDGTMHRSYPILDPAALGKMDGFSLAASGAPGATIGQPMPMPVRWLYVLQDGRLVVPTSGTGAKAKFDAAVVTKNNPIVSRIAFWTDDESCKVNINTASEGTPWDVPRSTSWTDRNYGGYVPAQNEFQRFPGHPAMTCLSPVLGGFDARFQWKDPGLNANGAVTSTPFQTFLQDTYSLLPRTNYGASGESSWGGSKTITSLTGTPVKRERLFASVDEFFYHSNRTRNGELSGVAPLDAEEMNVARFFLTAHSRAPETNVFNRPRISLWPMQANKSAPRTPKDKLLTFCATLAGQEVAWHRASDWQSTTNQGSSQSPTLDFNLSHNQRLFHYLQKLTSQPVPGFGTDTFESKYGKNNRNQILLQIFDMERWGLNSWCSLNDPASNTLDKTKSYFYLPPRAFSGSNPNYLGEASAVPTVVTALPNGDTPPAGKLKAFGRFHTIVEAAVVFMATAVEGTDGKPVTAASGGTPLDKVNNLTGAAGADGYADKTLKMRAYVVLQPFCPTVGMPPFTANIRYKIKGLESWTSNGQPLFPSNLSTLFNRATSPAGANNENAHATSYTGLHGQFVWRDGGTTKGKTVPGTDEDKNYVFCSDEVDVTGKTVFDMPGPSASTITIELHSGFGTAAQATDPLQTLELEFLKTTVRVPKLKMDQVAKMEMNERFKDIRNSLIGYGDTVRSVVVNATGPSKGDYRLIAALPTVTKNYFRPHPRYFSNAMSSTTNNWANPNACYWDEAQTLRYASNGYQGHYGRIHAQTGLSINGGNQHTWQASGYQFSADGKNIVKAYGLVKNTPYWQDCQPVCAINQDGAINADGRPGDWDMGTARIEDGPYINKPDEGGQDIGGGGYFGRGGFTEEKGRNYSPNRQICSAAAFGSLPTGIYSTAPRPWQTLLFCPNPPSRTTVATLAPMASDHFGFKTPRDHLLLDLFWMPIVEPYAISEPASTAGKINMNYQMLPFTHIQRATGLHAAMRSIRVTALPGAMAWAADATPGGSTTAQKQNCYKAFLDADNLKYDTHYDVNMTETLKGFQQRFDQGDVFHSASEICDLFLVPKPISGHSYIAQNALSKKALPKPGQSPELKDMISWWNGNAADPDDGFKLTGDNARESPYNQLYPRLTTRSNVFQIHYRVQVLKKARSTAAEEWDEDKDSVTAENRGSTLIERYLDPNDAAIPNFVANPSAAGALDDYYRFRILRQKQFSP